jgi:hypothetical protein
MDIFSLLLLLFLSYRNSIKAKQKALNGLVWGIITFVSVFFAELIGAAIVIFYFCRNVINIDKMATDPSYKETAMRQLTQEFIKNPLDPITVILFGIGGYLIVRYIIEKKPGKKDTESHWSDKLGENRDN